MGSLMSGWSSSVLSDKEVRLMRNRSMTKDEVAAFWRQQQHGSPATDPNAGSPRAEILVPLATKRQLEATRSLPPLPGRRVGGTRSNDDDLTACYSAYGYGAGDHHQLVSSRSVPPSPAATARREGFFLPDPENAAADGSGTSRGWWTRSSWAFLNEPPPPPPTGEEEVLLGRPQRSFPCDPQFHTARIVTGNA